MNRHLTLIIFMWFLLLGKVRHNIIILERFNSSMSNKRFNLENKVKERRINWRFIFYGCHRQKVGYSPLDSGRKKLNQPRFGWEPVCLEWETSLISFIFVVLCVFTIKATESFLTSSKNILPQSLFHLQMTKFHT